MTLHDTSSVQLPDDAGRLLQRLGQLLANELPDVREGQIWRATWSGASVAGVLLGLDQDDSTAEFAPFTVDVDYADPYTGVLSAADNPIGVGIAVFAGLTAPLPLFTLDRYLGELPESTTDALLQLWQANLSGLPPKDPPLRTGEPDIDVADPRRDYRNMLRAEVAVAQLADLRQATNLPKVDLPKKLLAAGVAPSDLVADGISLPYARQAAEGIAPVTATLAARIAELLDEPDQSLFEHDGPALPPALADCLNNPQRFTIVRKIMYTEDLNEVAAARRIPAIVKFRHIDPKPDENEHHFWTHALDMLAKCE